MENRINRVPDFDQIAKVLSCEKPDRPTLFEFYMNPDVYEAAAGPAPHNDDPTAQLAYMAKVFASCGYDYVFTYGSSVTFPTAGVQRGRTISLNGSSCIHDWDDFEKYPWPDALNADYSKLDKVVPYLPGNMKIMTAGPGGLLENMVSLVGYDNLCFMLYDEPELVQAVADKIGQILLDYYIRCSEHDSVGIIMVNDDWGFKGQTMFSVDDLRKYIFPWHKKMVDAAHSSGKFAALHSCGYMVDVMDDIIDDMKYDGKHSFEDNIVSVEDSYRRWGGRIAMLGGLDVDFLVRSSEDEIVERARGMLELSSEKGGYALGSGNSIPDYIPTGHYFAMTSVLND